MASLWRVALSSHFSDGTLHINTLGVKMDPLVGDGLSPVDLASHCYTWFGAEYRAILSAGLHWDTITVDSFPALGSQGVYGPNVNGLYANPDSYPKEEAYILAWKTGHATRSGRGHISVSLPAASELHSGSNIATGATYFATTVPAFLAKLDAGHDWVSGGITEGHLSHVVLSRKDATGYDVNARLIRNAVRWVERRQTAP